MKLAIITLGCKLNQAESEEIKNALKERGHVFVPSASPADVAIVRACAVTAGASQTAREMIRQAKRRGAYVIASGCLENRDLPEIDYVAMTAGDILKRVTKLDSLRLRLRRLADGGGGISGNDKVAGGILRLRDAKRPSAQNDNNTCENVKERTRAMIKIQDGCNFNCAYCVIPSFRGRATSVPVKKIIARIKRTEKNGYKEITLTGVNIGQYRTPSPSQSPPLAGGEDDRSPSFSVELPLLVPTSPTGGSPSKRGRENLADLLKKILAETKIERIRLGSLDPRLVTDKLIKIFIKDSPSSPPLYKRGKQKKSYDRLLPHWHLSLQSGSDAVLKRMNRGYDTKKYLAIVKKLRQANPLFSFTTDIIVGFPGETEKEFHETLAFVRKVGFAKAHVFPYSRRPNTPAAAMLPVHDKTKTERVARLIKTAGETAEKFAKKFIGKMRPVLFESRKKDLWFGYTPEYVPIYFRSDKNLKNKIVGVEITPKGFLHSSASASWRTADPVGMTKRHTPQPLSRGERNRMAERHTPSPASPAGGPSQEGNTM